MREKKIIRIVIVMLVALLGLIALFIAFAPWQGWVQQKLITAIEQSGIKPARLTVKGISLHGLVLTNIALGEPPLTLNNLDLQYSLRDLLQQKMDSTLTLRSAAIAFTAGDKPLTISTAELTLTPHGSLNQWRGIWTLTDVALADEALGLPKLSGSGSLALAREKITAEGHFTNAAKTHNADFTVTYLPQQKNDSLLTITQVQVPWGGGMVGAKNMRIPLAGLQAVNLTLDVDKVDVQALLQALTSAGTTATGAVSGTVPITLAADGTLSIGKGDLRAIAPGIITLAPETIPGDNPQVAIVREALKNLHYSLLSLTLSMDADHKLAAELLVDGSNPEFEHGRPIKLKVHLSGDLLNLITQNAKLVTDPKNFIEQSTHE